MRGYRRRLELVARDLDRDSARALRDLVDLLIEAAPAEEPDLDPIEVGGQYELTVRIVVTVVDADGASAEVKLDQRAHQRPEDRTLALDADEIVGCRRVG